MLSELPKFLHLCKIVILIPVRWNSHLGVSGIQNIFLFLSLTKHSITYFVVLFSPKNSPVFAPFYRLPGDHEFVLLCYRFRRGRTFELNCFGMLWTRFQLSSGNLSHRQERMFVNVLKKLIGLSFASESCAHFYAPLAHWGLCRL